METEEESYRPSRAMLHMFMAHAWARRSLCKRPGGQVGCVITTQDMRRVLSIGYNGPGPKLPHDRCRNVTGGCGCGHAESHAVAMVDSTIPNKIAFITTTPCELCAQLLAHAGVVELYYGSVYRDQTGLALLNEMGVSTRSLTLSSELKEALSLLT